VEGATRNLGGSMGGRRKARALPADRGGGVGDRGPAMLDGPTGAFAEGLPTRQDPPDIVILIIWHLCMYVCMFVCMNVCMYVWGGGSLGGVHYLDPLPPFNLRGAGV
jgi:hypothetical protein